jgi:hypothetical protein
MTPWPLVPIFFSVYSGQITSSTRVTEYAWHVLAK